MAPPQSRSKFYIFGAFSLAVGLALGLLLARADSQSGDESITADESDAGGPDAEREAASDSVDGAYVPSELPELDLKLDEPTLKAPGSGILFVGDRDEAEPPSNAPDDSAEEVELAPPPVLPQSDAGGNRVEQ